MSNTSDPHHSREKKRYKSPIASREHIQNTLKKHAKGLVFEKVCQTLAISAAPQKEALTWRLKAMLRDGQVFMQGERYCVVTHACCEQALVVYQDKAWGVRLKEGGFCPLPGRMAAAVFEGDAVWVLKSAYRRGTPHWFLSIAHRHDALVGSYQREGRSHWVSVKVPDGMREIVLKTLPKKKPNVGDLCAISVDLDIQPRASLTGVIQNILGPAGLLDARVAAAIAQHQIPTDWSSAIQKETKKYPKAIRGVDKKGRLDLTHLPFVTIDGEDARDFDDALYCKPKPKGGFELCIAIADVSHYVKPDMALDEEALKRGNSVYFPQAVVPMLPKVLSNGLCSLKPRVERLAFVCMAHIDAKGMVESFVFREAVIVSKARLTYTKVAAYYKGKKLSASKAVLKNLDALDALYPILKAAHERLGVIAFEFPETQLLFDDENHLDSIQARERNVAHKLVEACMLVANVSAARLLQRHKKTALYRNHPAPEEDKLEELRAFLKPRGLRLKGGLSPRPKDYAQVLKQAAGHAEYTSIELLLLRSMGQAYYGPDNIGHFGLAFERYTHFTSPIRRYADLCVHRAIKSIGQRLRLLAKKAHEMGVHLSMTERRADKATRAVVDGLKCEFIAGYIGKTLPGKVVSVTSFGLFVQLKDFFIEGLVHVSQLPGDFYDYDAQALALVGRQSRVRYQIGDVLDVVVTRADSEAGQIDFVPAEERKKSSKKSKKRKQR